MEAAELLRSYALSRGFVAASGLPDETRSGRQILKDFVNGKLLHCERPPTCALSNVQLGLTGQVATTPSRHAMLRQAGASDTAAHEAEQDKAQLNGESQSQPGDSAAEQDESSEQDDSDGAESSQDDSTSAADAAAVSGDDSDPESPAAAHMVKLNNADRELMESMASIPGAFAQRQSASVVFGFLLSTVVTVNQSCMLSQGTRHCARL